MKSFGLGKKTNSRGQQARGTCQQNLTSIATRNLSQCLLLHKALDRNLSLAFRSRTNIPPLRSLANSLSYAPGRKARGVPDQVISWARLVKLLLIGVTGNLRFGQKSDVLGAKLRTRILLCRLTHRARRTARLEDIYGYTQGPFLRGNSALAGTLAGFRLFRSSMLFPQRACYLPQGLPREPAFQLKDFPCF